MITGFYSAAGALDVASQMYEVVGHNLAHVDIPGFRRSTVIVESFDQSLSEASGDTGTEQPDVAEVRTVFEQGRFEHTGNRLDLALKGDGFFVVQGPDGPLYTRNGVFQLNSAGELMTQAGMPIMGASGPVSIPPGTSEIVILKDGAVLADGAEVDRLEMVTFADPESLMPVGTTLFEAAETAGPQESTASVQQGYREGANVDVVHELVQMIVALRLYEAAQRATVSLDQSIQQQTSPQAQ